MNLSKFAIGVAVVAMVCAVSACKSRVRYASTGTTVSGKAPGPPPHAPAHGYRHKQANGAVLVYESKLGLYVVSGRNNYYYNNKSYYRSTSSGWQVAVKLDGPWKSVSTKKIPRGLQKNPGKNKGKNKGKK
jgi:hypothetical protein